MIASLAADTELSTSGDELVSFIELELHSGVNPEWEMSLAICIGLKAQPQPFQATADNLLKWGEWYILYTTRCH